MTFSGFIRSCCLLCLLPFFYCPTVFPCRDGPQSTCLPMDVGRLVGKPPGRAFPVLGPGQEGSSSERGGGHCCVTQESRRTRASIWLQRVGSKSRGLGGGERDLTALLITPCPASPPPSPLPSQDSNWSRAGSLFQEPTRFRKPICMAKAPWFRMGN